MLDEQIQGTIFNNIKKNPALEFITDNVESLPQIAFNKAINSFFIANGMKRVDRNITDEILNGNYSALSKTLEVSLGISPIISEGMIGILMNDEVLIMDCIEKVSIILRTDPKINIIFAKIILDQIKSEEMSKESVSKATIKEIKAFVTYFSPSFPSEVIE